jgi:hypothetical protein
MPDSAKIIHDGDESCRLQISHRDWMLTAGPGFAEGDVFENAFGIFENFTTGGGLPSEPWVLRDGQTLFDGASVLLAAIERDYELLRYDYSCKVGHRHRSYGGGESVRVDDRPGMLWLRPKGYCAITFVDDLQPQVIDLRAENGFMTDDGPVKVYRRKAEVHWLEILPPVLEFLRHRLTRELALEHIDRVR